MSQQCSIRRKVAQFRKIISTKVAFQTCESFVKTLRSGTFPDPPKLNVLHVLDGKNYAEISTSESLSESGEGSLEDLDFSSPKCNKQKTFSIEIDSQICHKLMDCCLTFEDYLRSRDVQKDIIHSVQTNIRLIISKISQNESLFTGLQRELIALVTVLTAAESSLLDGEILLVFFNNSSDSPINRINKLANIKKTRAYLILKRLMSAPIRLASF